MNTTYSRKYLTQTLKKELKKPSRQAFLLQEIKRLELILEPEKELNIKRQALIEEYRSRLTEMKKEFSDDFNFNKTPDHFQLEYRSIKEKLSELGKLMNEPQSKNLELKRLKRELSILSRDNRVSFFIDVVKGYLSKEKFIELWEKSNAMYEEALLEICEKSMDELRKEISI